MTLEQAKIHLRRTDTTADVDIYLKVNMASSIVMKYIKKDDASEWGLGTSPETYAIPTDVQSATLLVLGELFENREGATADVLSETVKNLLSQYWTPALS